MIEYLGCIFHGCDTCFLPQDVLKVGITNYDALQKTRKRIKLLERHSEVEKVTCMKSCVWNKMKKEKNSEVLKFLESFKTDRLDRRLSMKKTFRGGLVS